MENPTEMDDFGIPPFMEDPHIFNDGIGSRSQAGKARLNFTVVESFDRMSEAWEDTIVGRHHCGKTPWGSQV